MPLAAWIAVVGAFVASVVVTGLVRAYALHRSVLDVPNDRSSHTVPTPRGGGLAIVVAALAVIGAGAAFDLVPGRLALAVGVGGGAIALVGWVDDHRPLSARSRLVAQFAAAGFAVWLLGGLPVLDLGHVEVPLGPVGAVLSVVTLVWLTNLYNFMDGIDGLAGGEAVLVAGAGGALAAAVGAPGIAFAAWSVAAASAGFLVWNWPPARIFMGDVGSAFLGFAIGVLALASERGGAVPILVWLLLLGAFVFDATVTLARRALRRERLSAPHRSHAYQRLARSAASHRTATLATLGVGLALAALAAWAVTAPAMTVPAFGLGAVVLLVAYVVVERAAAM